MKCCIVKDLLPNYIDGLTSEEANEEIRKHLETCEDCRSTCEQMSISIPGEITEADCSIDFLKKMRKRLRKQYVAVILLTCVVLASLTVFAQKYTFPIPYDANCMTIEFYQAAPVTHSFGTAQWEDLDRLDFETSKAVITGNYDTTYLVRLVITEPALWDDLQSCGRTIHRGNETVRVVYYCYTISLWRRLFPNAQARPNRMTSTGDIYGMRLYQTEYQPIMTELYYLPMNSRQLQQLSDAEFDAQKENAVQVWSGIN